MRGLHLLFCAFLLSFKCNLAQRYQPNSRITILLVMTHGVCMYLNSRAPPLRFTGARVIQSSLQWRFTGPQTPENQCPFLDQSFKSDIPSGTQTEIALA